MESATTISHGAKAILGLATIRHWHQWCPFKHPTEVCSLATTDKGDVYLNTQSHKWMLFYKKKIKKKKETPKKKKNPQQSEFVTITWEYKQTC